MTRDSIFLITAIGGLAIAGCVPQHYTQPRAVQPDAPVRRSTAPTVGGGGTRGHMEAVVVAQHSLMIEGFVLIKGRLGNGFVAGLLSKGSDVKFLPRKEVHGRFSVDYNLRDYVGWEYSITLYAHEADEAGMSKVLTTLSGIHR